MSINIVTGMTGTNHVTSAQDGRKNAFTFGAGRYVFDSGSKFAYELISNNLIKIADGDLIDQGRHICTEPNDYTELTIDNGITGNNRKDLIVMRYAKDANTGIESAELVVLKGISTAGAAADPEYTVGDIMAGELLDELPLYRVNIEGLSVTSVEPLFGLYHGDMSDMLLKNGNSEETTVTFESGDVLNPTAWADVGQLKSGEKLGRILGKISAMLKNIRWLKKKTDELNTNLVGKASSDHNHNDLYQVKGSYAAYNHNHKNTFNTVAGESAYNMNENSSATVNISIAIPSGYAYAGVDRLNSGAVSSGVIVAGYNVSGSTGTVTVSLYLRNLASSARTSTAAVTLRTMSIQVN